MILQLLSNNDNHCHEILSLNFLWSNYRETMFWYSTKRQLTVLLAFISPPMPATAWTSHYTKDGDGWSKTTTSCVQAKLALHHWTTSAKRILPSFALQDHLVMRPPHVFSISDASKTKNGDGGNRTPDFLYAKQTFYHWTTSPWWVLLH